jgi:hypothetical protein
MDGRSFQRLDCSAWTKNFYSGDGGDFASDKSTGKNAAIAVEDFGIVVLERRSIRL